MSWWQVMQASFWTGWKKPAWQLAQASSM